MFQTVVATGGARLDKYLVAAGTGLSRSEIQRLIEEGRILVDGKGTKPHHRIRKGERIEVLFEKPASGGRSVIEPEEIPLDIAYEDEDLIVLNKSAGIVVHPAIGNSHGTLVNGLLYHCKNLPSASSETRPGVVHRLDKDTTGLLVFGKTDFALQELMTQMKKRKMTRRYLALTWGRIPQRSGVIEAPIGRHLLDRKRMTVTPLRSRNSLTRYTLLERFSIATYIELQLETGRTHQVRVHLAHFGYPVVGDPTYSGRKKGMIKGLIQRDKGTPRRAGGPAGWSASADLEKVINQILLLISRQALHAAILGFFHPRKKEWMEFKAPLPEDMTGLLSYFRSMQN
ncbi:RluA family pseudouridine synthase [candidate division TA06 bacterium]|nr:RluA family pseudouridine synthase [candidate division TA06 bacterium]